MGSPSARKAGLVNLLIQLSKPGFSGLSDSHDPESRLSPNTWHQWSHSIHERFGTVVCITSVGLTEPSCDMVICQITESVEVTNLGTPTPFDQSRSCDVQTELNSDATMISRDDAQSMQRQVQNSVGSSLVTPAKAGVQHSELWLLACGFPLSRE